ncbi:MAG: hypothetical protein IJQ57_01750 [Synergistaceae bacterium]|nr:hypothetical protein [Synergistaceae bacterium]MBR0252053.1 hypothetical protein [Synergistaceae bacterium]
MIDVNFEEKITEFFNERINAIKIKIDESKLDAEKFDDCIFEAYKHGFRDALQLADFLAN